MSVINGTVWIVAIGAAAVLVGVFTFLARRRAVGGRTPITLEEIPRT